MPKALYPGSFDPFSMGHLDVAARSAAIFDELLIAVYSSPTNKGLMFTTEERVALVRQSVEHLPNVDVVPFGGLVVEFARNAGAKVIVRGLRTAADFEYEYEMAFMNKKLAPDIELVCLMTSLQYQFVSASLLKEVASLGGDIEGLVPKHVAEALSQKLADLVQTAPGERGTSSIT